MKKFVAVFIIASLLLVGTAFAATILPFNYGQLAIGSTERVVYQQPMVMQDLNGTIQTVIVSITVWRT